MTPPGERLRRAAARLFSAETMERLIDPVIADLQAEYEQAVRSGRVWTSRWVRLSRPVSLLRTILIYEFTAAAMSIQDWSGGDWRAFGRTLGCSITAVLLATLLLFAWPLHQIHLKSPGHTRALLYLVPQAFAIGVPIGVTFGILYGLRGRGVSRRLRGAVLAMAVICSIDSFVNLAWMVPTANQLFNKSVSGVLGLSPADLTLRELARKVDAERRSGQSRQPMAVIYYTRWALTFAPLALALVALSTVTRRLRSRFVLGASGCAAVVIYYALLDAGNVYARQGALPAHAIAWLPNVGMVILSLALLALARRSATGLVTAPPAV